MTEQTEKTDQSEDKISDYAKKAEKITAEQLAKTEELLTQNQEALSTASGSASLELEQQMTELFDRVNGELVKAMERVNETMKGMSQ